MLRRPALLAAALALVTSGCTLTRTHVNAESWRSGVHTLAVIPAVKVVEMQAGDVAEEHEEWTAQARTRVLGALDAELKARGVATRLLKVKGDAELEEVVLLFDSVLDGILKFTIGAYANDYKVAHFEYSVGDLRRVLDKVGADGLLVVRAVDQVSTAGHRLTSPLHFGAAGVYMASFDRSGQVIWFDAWGGAVFDLRDERDVRQLVATVLTSFPGSRR